MSDQPGPKAGESPRTMVGLESVSKTFNPGTVNAVTAMRSVSLTVLEGQFVTIIGSNGAGKTTLLNMISGTFAPSSGSITVAGQDVTRQPEYRRARIVGRIFQDPLVGTAGNMSVEDNMIIAYRKGFKGLRISLTAKMRRMFRERLAELEMGLENRMKDNVGLLSGGQRQALTLLMMVLSRPRLILLDEHTAALDPKNAQLVLDLTMRFIADYGLTTVMVTHNMNQAIRYGDRLLMMDGGEVILDVGGAAKRALTVDALVQKFHDIRHHQFESDEVLLSDE